MIIVYEIRINDVRRYVGVTDDIKRRTYEHNHHYKIGKKKELYTELRNLNWSAPLELRVLFTFGKKSDAEKMEALLILMDYFTKKDLWQAAPVNIKYWRKF